MTTATLPLVNPLSGGLSLASSLNPSPSHLSLRVACCAASEGDVPASFIAHQYATYPFRLSGNLPIDPTDSHRVYAYVMNVSPGLLSGDNLWLALQLCDRTHLYLTDQSATKVHSRPTGGAIAQVNWTIQVGDQAYLEYIPEPIILFPAATLSQQMDIILHPRGRLVLGETVVPGRLARGEFYVFDQFQSRMRVRTPEGQLCFADNLRLVGQSNPVKHSPFLMDYPILGNFIVVLPGIALPPLIQQLQAYEEPLSQLRVGCSPLPGCNGVLVRAIATQVAVLKPFQRHVLNCVRQVTGQPPLPHIPK